MLREGRGRGERAWTGGSRPRPELMSFTTLVLGSQRLVVLNPSTQEPEVGARRQHILNQAPVADFFIYLKYFEY